MAHDTKSLTFRYGEPVRDQGQLSENALLKSMAERGSCREFKDDHVDLDTIRLLCGIALASPTKSDLQQRDIVVVRDPKVRDAIAELVGGQTWVTAVPNLVVFCGNNRRQRLVHDMRGHAFVNDHLDAFFNAAVDAGIALSAFVTAAEAMGLGCCPISAVRNKPTELSDLLELPDHVFPVAGLAFGHPKTPEPKVSMRLPLEATVHVDRFSEDGIEAVIAQYDQQREAAQPYEKQVAPEVFGTSDEYGWSEAKSRQYALPERQSFGAFVRAKGFDLS
ncbi:nitroreductase family protein [Planktotalea sp.]|uniref:nitroreductase family protein n=1 Tax=Planktotalea sp. TaxID=2029877 RepID=UPI003297D52B